MNITELCTWLTKQPALYGHLGNTFKNQKRINIKGSDLFFIVEQQTLFNYKIVYHIENIKKTAYIVAYSPANFYEKHFLIVKYFYDFPTENFIVI